MWPANVAAPVVPRKTTRNIDDIRGERGALDPSCHWTLQQQDNCSKQTPSFPAHVEKMRRMRNTLLRPWRTGYNAWRKPLHPLANWEYKTLAHSSKIRNMRRKQGSMLRPKIPIDAFCQTSTLFRIKGWFLLFSVSPKHNETLPYAKYNV